MTAVAKAERVARQQHEAMSCRNLRERVRVRFTGIHPEAHAGSGFLPAPRRELAHEFRLQERAALAKLRAALLARLVHVLDKELRRELLHRRTAHVRDETQPRGRIDETAMRTQPADPEAAPEKLAHRARDPDRRPGRETCNRRRWPVEIDDQLREREVLERRDLPLIEQAREPAP